MASPLLMPCAISDGIRSTASCCCEWVKGDISLNIQSASLYAVGELCYAGALAWSINKHHNANDDINQHLHDDIIPMDSRLPDFHTLPYQPDTLLHLFARFSHQPWAMLLHSGFAEHQHNRFDIMVADPVATLTTDGNETLITRADGTARSTQDSFLLLRQAMTQAGISARTHPDMPFQGGALGLFSYDLGRRVETLPSQAKQDIHLPDMAVGIYDGVLIADHQ